MKRMLGILAVILAAVISSLSAASLNESFDGTTFPPTGWSVINLGDTKTWVRSTTTPHSGAACARIAFSTDAHDDYLITPQMTVVAGDRLKFWAKNHSVDYPEAFNVKVSNGGATAEEFTDVLAADVVPPGTAWTEYTYDLSAYDGKDIYVAIQAISADMYYLYIDDVTVDQPPANPTFTITPATKNFNTNVIGSETALSKFVISNDGAGTLTINSQSDIVIAGSVANQFVLVDSLTYPVNLTTAQKANIYVKFVPTVAGADSAKMTITTAGDKAVHTDCVKLYGSGYAPYTTAAGGFNEDFDGTLVPLLTSGWGLNNYGTYHSAANWGYTNALNGIMIFPKMTIVAGDWIDYWHAVEDVAQVQDVEVRMSTTTTALDQFTTVLKTYTGLANAADAGAADRGYVHDGIDLTAYAGQSVYVAFVKTNSDPGYYGYCLDDVRFINMTTASINTNILPKETTLFQNYPNPFNPETSIKFYLANNSSVKLAVYNSKGEQVASLINQNMVKGLHNVNFNGNSLNSGVYFYKLEAEGRQLTSKMILVK